METEYKGYKINTSDNRGGKAGVGRNKTKTIRVTEKCGDGFLIKKQFTYKVDSHAGFVTALVKCKDFIDTLPLIN